MKNSVIVVSEGDDRSKIYISLKDDSNIVKYGLLTEVVTVDDKNRAQARNIARTTLNDLNRVNDTISCEMLGHDDVRAGRVIKLNEIELSLVGKYLILGVNHTVNNGIHKAAVELKEVK
ncbi:phage late control protein GPD [compost metagenome]